jgi:hypothetical protein
MSTTGTRRFSDDLLFGLVAGELAGLVVACQFGLSDLIVGVLRCSTKLEIQKVAWSALESSSRLSPCLLLGGALLGLAALVLGRMVPLHKSALGSKLLAWVLGPLCWIAGSSAVYLVFGSTPLRDQTPEMLTDALVILILAVAAYGGWCGLLHWLRRARVRPSMWAIGAMGMGLLFIPLIVSIILT